MAVRKYLLKHYNETTKEDSSIHLQTSSDIVLRPDGSSVEDALSSVTSDVNKLTSDNGEGSIKQAVADGISSIVAGAPESLDTLKEMSDWIQTHENDASAMNSRITKNTNDIAALSEDVADTTATVNANNVKITNLQSTVNSATSNIDDKLGKSETAVAATKLATARTVRTNLGSTGTASFDGTANITPGVTGVLPVANGGTGVSTLSALSSAIVGANVPAKPNITSSTTIDSSITWRNTTWQVVYNDTHIAILMMKTVDLTISDYIIPYSVSQLSQMATSHDDNWYRDILNTMCMKIAARLGICNCDYIMNLNSDSPIFIPTAVQRKLLITSTSIPTNVSGGSYRYSVLYDLKFTDNPLGVVDYKNGYTGSLEEFGYGIGAYTYDVYLQFLNAPASSYKARLLYTTINTSLDGAAFQVNRTNDTTALYIRPMIAIKI